MIKNQPTSLHSQKKSTYVIKIGGSLLHQPDESMPLVALAIAKLKQEMPHCQIALVHGGGHHIRTALEASGYNSQVIDGYRVTPEDHMPTVENVLFHTLYQQLYAHLQQHGLAASLWTTPTNLPVLAQQKKAPCGTPLWACVGDELTYQTDILWTHLNKGHILLLPSLAQSANHLCYNVNADDMAKSLAVSLNADALIYLTDVEGVLDQDGQILNHLTPESADIHMAQGHLNGGMKVKVIQGFGALKMGVQKVLLCPLNQLAQGIRACSTPQAGASSEQCGQVGTTLLLKASPEHHHLMKTYQRKPLTFIEGYGPWLVAEDSTTYLDMVSGVAVNTLGHAHPKITEAIEAQAGKLIHLSNLYYTNQQMLLAERLTALSGMDSVFLSNSGTEAVEAALKIARKFGSLNGGYKRKILHLSGSFHGRTFGALTVTANVHYQAPFLPLVADTEEIPSGDITTLKRIMSDNVCALILEPIQGESGVHPVDPAFIAAARELCDQHKALLIFDEVQCGIGRTGSLFYFEQLGIKPDIVCLAKGLGGGFPIGATLVNSRANVLSPGDHGSTFGGNPLACACANAILETVMSDKLLESVAKLGKRVKNHFAKRPHQLIEKVTGVGLFLGIHLYVPAKDVIEAAQEQGLLLIGGGAQTVRLLPPLTVTEEVLDLALMRLYSALNSLSEQSPRAVG